MFQCFFYCSTAENQFLSKEENGDSEDEDDEETSFGKKVTKKTLIEELQSAVKTDEETLHIEEGKSGKQQKKEKKEFRRKIIDLVLQKLPSLQTRSRRAGLVHNFLRGLGLNELRGEYIRHFAFAWCNT